MRVSARERRTWFVILRPNGCTRRYTIGTFPAISLAAARQKARDLLAAAQLGADQAEEKQRLRRAETVPQLAEKFIKNLEANKLQDSKEVASSLRRDFVPRFRTRKAVTIAPWEIAVALEEVDERARSASRKLLENVRRMYNFGIGRETYAVAAALVIILLTLNRAREFLKLRRKFIDFEFDASFILKDVKSREPGLDHAVPITPLVAALMRRQEQLQPAGEFLFQSEGRFVARGKPSVPLSLSHLGRRLKAVLARAKLPDAVPHDLRRTGTTQLSRLGVTKDILDKLLAHMALGVTDRHYNLYDKFPERRAALEAWEAELLRYPEIKAVIDTILAKEV